MTFQSTPKSSAKSDGPPRTRRLTAAEPTYKSTRSRESSTERILDEKSTRNRSRSYEPKKRSQNVISIDPNSDVELTLDDLETKFAIDDADVNHARQITSLSSTFG